MPDHDFLKHVARAPRIRPLGGWSTASDDLFNCTELVEGICSLCDWTSLVMVGNSNQRLRVIVQDVIRRRIIFGLSRFLRPKYHARFFDLLDSTEAAIVGGFIRHIMCLEEEIYRVVFPSQLSILVPTGKGNDLDGGRKWHHFLSNCIGFEGEWDNDTSLPYTNSSTRTSFFNHVTRDIQISLVECDDDNIISTLVYAPETSVFNVLTSRRIYSFYPTSFACRVNLETSTILMASRLRDSIRPFRFGFTTYGSMASSYLFFPCKEGCYSRTRNVGKMEGISRFRWGGLKGEYDQDNFFGEPSLVDPFEALDVEWKIGSRCGNSMCPYYRLGFIG